jgi:hypothetical protein
MDFRAARRRQQQAIVQHYLSERPPRSLGKRCYGGWRDRGWSGLKTQVALPVG